MNLLKTSAYSAVSQATTVAVGLLSVKIVAAKIGPEGVALQGQFINSTAIISIFASGAVGAGVIKYLAEYTSDKNMQIKVIRTSFLITFLCSASLAIVSIGLAEYFSQNTLKNLQYAPAYWIYGFFLPLISFNTLFSYILNGLKKIPLLTSINIFTSIVNLVLLLLLVNHLGVLGVLVAASFVSGFVFILNVVFFMKYKWFPLKDLKPIWDRDLITKLLKFSSMSLLAGFGMPFVQIIIRDNIIEKLGMKEAGFWQMVVRISDFYLSFLVAVLSIYFLPKLSELKKDEDIKKEVYQTAKYVMPAICIMSFSIWLGKDLIIKYLLTDKFVPVRNLFHFQLLGDIFKVGGWILSNILWAKALTRKYLLIDGFALLLYVLVSFLCIHFWGLQGATLGFCVSYFVYFLLMVVANKRYLY